jgi:hypothetical protein
MQQASVRDPISEGWMRTGAPVDYLRRLTVHCPRDQKQTTQAEYRVIMGGWPNTSGRQLTARGKGAKWGT